MDPVSPKDRKTPTRSSPFRKRRNICLAVVIGLLCFVIVLVILGFTVFKPKHAVTTVNSVDLKSLKLALDVLRVRVDLNVTVNINLSVKNPNKAGFKYGNGSSILYYRGDVVGEAAVPAGKISAGEKIDLNTTVTVLADRLLSNSDVYSDVVSGNLPINTYTRMPGRVIFLKIFKHHVVSYTSCDLSINALNKTVENLGCKYKTKL